jgi:hypothetical protein
MPWLRPQPPRSLPRRLRRTRKPLHRRHPNHLVFHRLSNHHSPAASQQAGRLSLLVQHASRQRQQSRRQPRSQHRRRLHLDKHRAAILQLLPVLQRLRHHHRRRKGHQHRQRHRGRQRRLRCKRRRHNCRQQLRIRRPGCRCFFCRCFFRGTAHHNYSFPAQRRISYRRIVSSTHNTPHWSRQRASWDGRGQ